MKKIKQNSKIKKRPVSCLDKKTQYSQNNLPLYFSPKISELKSPLTNLINNNDNLKGNLTERKFNNDLNNLSYKIFNKEKNSLKTPQYLRKIETPKKAIYNYLLEKKVENNEDLGLSEFIVINNEHKKKENTSRNSIKNNSRRRLSFTTLHHRKGNLLHKSLSNFKSKMKNNDSFNNKIKLKDKHNSNHLYNYKRDYIKKKILNNIVNYQKNNKDNNNNTITNSLDMAKTNSITYKSLINNSSKTSKNKNISDINKNEKIEINKNEYICENININDIETESTKIKNKYSIKFAKVAEIYKKFSSNAEWIRIDFRNTFLNLLNNVFKSLESYNNFILHKYKINNILTVDIWANSLKIFFDFCGNVIKWQKMMIEEIRIVRKENIFLNKKLFHTENELNLKDKEIKDINNNIIKYDLDKVKSGKVLFEKVEKIKNKYINHESNYILTIYQLESELKNLSDILSKNKFNQKRFDELIEKYNYTRDEYDKNKADYKEYEFQSEKKIISLTQYNSELNQKINNLENELKIIKDKENEYTEQIIVLKSKIEYSNKIINQKEISILQLKSEIKNLTEIKMAGMLQPAKTVFVPCQ